MDERYLMHRYKSTSHAAMVAAVAMAGTLIYDLVKEGTLRWDLHWILIAMAVTKVAFMLYYRRTD